jgi:hypothetical protein
MDCLAQCANIVQEGHLLCESHQNHDIRLLFPTIHSLQIWAQRLEELNNTAPTPALSFSFAIGTNSRDYEDDLMRVHNHLLSAKDPVEWKHEILESTPSLFRLEDCTDSKYELEHKNTFFVADVGDLLAIILLKASVRDIPPSELLNTMSIYQYDVRRDDLKLVMLTPSYGYLDAEKWVKAMDDRYTKGFSSTDTGNTFVLATYIDEKTTDLAGFVDDGALYGYYGLNKMNPLEILLTGTTLQNGAISVGTRVDIADVAELEIGLLDFLFHARHV